MSARVAYVLWHNRERSLQPSEGWRLGMTWAEAAGDYRALVRAAMRMLEKEGIHIRSAPARKSLTRRSPEWMKSTARFAWLLWMRANRETGRISLSTELKVWEVEAASFRQFVRSAMIALEADGIYILN